MTMAVVFKPALTSLTHLQLSLSGRHLPFSSAFLPIRMVADVGEISAYGLLLVLGVVCCWGGVLISRQHRSRQEIDRDRANGATFWQAIAKAPFPVMIHAEDGEVLQINAIWTEITGYTHADIPTIRDWATLAYGDRAATILDTKIACKYSLDSPWDEGEFTIATRDGEQRILHFSTAPLGQMPDGRRVAVSMAADVTQQRVAAALRESEALHRSLFEQTVVGLANATVDGQLLDVNQRVCDMLGYSRAELLTKTLVELTHPEHRARTAVEVRRLFAGEIEYFFQEKQYLRKDGSTFWSNTGVSLVRDAAGNPKCILAVIHDITQRRQALEELQQSQQVLRTILDTLPLSIFWKDRESVYLGCNQNFAKEAGVSAADIVGKTDLELPWTEAEATGYRTDDRQVMDSAVAKLGIIETQVQADGKQAWVETHKVPLQDSEERVVGVVGAYQDVTDREQAQMTVKQQLAAIEAVAEGISVLRDGAYINLNRAHLDLFGYDRADELIGQNWRLSYPPEEIDRFEREILPALARAGTWQGEATAKRRDGSTFIQGLSLTRADDGLLICVCRDISARKATEEALRASEERYRLLAENANDLICLHDPGGRYLFVSPSCETLLGYHHSEMVGCDPDAFLHPEDRVRIRVAGQTAAIGPSTPVTYRMRTKSGSYIWLETLTQVIQDSHGQVVQLQTTSRDITERVKAQERLVYEAYHDTLTGLPNRAMLAERLDLCLRQQQRQPDQLFALLFVDLDRFKVINDSLGHASGDRVLMAVAQRLAGLVRNTDLAVRLGGDEFVVLLTNLVDISGAVRVAERLLQDLQEPIDLEGRQVVIGASIGVALGSDRHTCADDVLRDADLAMYRAKGCNETAQKVTVFNAAMHTRVLQRLHLENDLRVALQKQEFHVDYQPIVELTTGKPVLLEALVRWQPPGRETISPQDFIPIAKETGVIVPLDRWVLKTACQSLATWRQGRPQAGDLGISVNYCARDLQAPDLLASIDNLLESLHLTGHCLTIEITERLLITNFAETIAILEELKARHINLSIDDFGTGYSSLAYLHQLPVDSLKIDRSFVSKMQSDRRSYEIVETIITLSKRLGIRAIAEGIETQQQYDLLLQLGCDLGQGYHLAKPMRADACAAWFQVPTVSKGY